MIRTTLGQVLVNEALPEDLKDYARVYTKKSIPDLYMQIAKQYPDKYKDIVQQQLKIGQQVSTRYGRNASLSMHDVEPPEGRKEILEELRTRIDKINELPISRTERNKRIVLRVLDAQKVMKDLNMVEGEKDGNTFALQILSGARGNESQFASLRVGDGLVTDHRDEPIPIPILHSYAEGLDPVEYWAGSYGARKGTMSGNLGTPKSGFFGKQLALSAHRILVTEKDCGTTNGLPVDANDPDNEGTLLAKDYGKYKANDVIRPNSMKDLKKEKTILVRSPITCEADHGVCQKCAGIRESGDFPQLGDNVGTTAATAISEPMTQAPLCLAEGTLTRMADWGVKPIEEIKVGDSVLGADNTGRTFPVTVKKVFCNGERECCETIFRVDATKSEVSLISTAEHKLLATTSVWPFSAEDRKSGVYPVDINARRAGKKMKRFSAIRSTGFNSSDMPEDRYALLLGLLLGDGCYTQAVHGCFLSCHDPLLIEDTKDYLASLNLVATKLAGHIGYYRISQIKEEVTPRDTEGHFCGSFRNPAMKRLTELEMIHKYAHEKSIPVEVFHWDNNSVAYLLAGLFATDGSVFVQEQAKQASGHVLVNFTSTSKQLVEQVCDLLAWRFGVYTGPVHHDRLEERRDRYSATIGHQCCVDQFIRCIPLVGIKRITAKKLAKERDLTRVSHPSRLHRKEQTYVGYLPTYDLEVDHPDHLFVLANGLIVSNSAKHTGGVAEAKEKKISGFDAINRLVQIPKTFPETATVSKIDGVVTNIEKAPQGGWFIQVGAERHYVPGDREISVKEGETLEAGDPLSDGIHNPSDVAKYKGIGQARKAFVEQFRQVADNTHIRVNRRNLELLSRGIVNHVRVNDLDGVDDALPGDIREYDSVVRNYQPRFGFKTLPPSRAVGYYLEKPINQYSIGSRVTPRMAKELQKQNVKELVTHPDLPPFNPEMRRIMETLSYSDDWMTRLGGWYLKKGLGEAARLGATSKQHGLSYIPSLAQGTEFGRVPSGKGY